MTLRRHFSNSLAFRVPVAGRTQVRLALLLAMLGHRLARMKIDRYVDRAPVSCHQSNFVGSPRCLFRLNPPLFSRKGFERNGNSINQLVGKSTCSADKF